MALPPYKTQPDGTRIADEKEVELKKNKLSGKPTEEKTETVAADQNRI